MIVSMTGFGRGEAEKDGIVVTVELMSVNGRFLDFTMRLPRNLSQYEIFLRRKLSQKINRGRVTLNVFTKTSSESETCLYVKEDIAKAYLEQFQQMKATFNLQGELDPCTLIQLPEVIMWQSEAEDSSKTRFLVTEALNKAIKEHYQMRCNEGKAIEKDLVKRAGKIIMLIKRIEKNTPESPSRLRKHLTKRIRQLELNNQVSEDRIAMEVALFAERTDVTEEGTRIRSHLKQFLSEIQKKVTSGRKLIFIVQEILRETNTIAAKAQNFNTSRDVVLIKEELEKIREQTENIE